MSNNTFMSKMLQEIEQQPAALEKTIRAEMPKLARLGALLRKRDVGLIFLVARGSSDNAALFGRYLLEITTGLPVAMAAPSVSTLYGKSLNFSHSLVIGISQSGEGEDINHVLRDAKENGAFTIGICNEPDSPMAGLVDEVLLMHGGREQSVAATKTYTGQLLLISMLAEAMGGKVPGLDIESIPEFASRALQLRPVVQEMVQRYVFMENCVVVGRGLMYGNTFEWALKLMETCYVVAERFSSADFQHGPVAVVERHFPVFAFAPPGVTLPGVNELLRQLRSLRADTLVITSDDEAAESSTRAIRMPAEIHEFIAPIPYMIPAQLFTALLSQAKGLDPDTPRSLSKITRTL